MAYPVYEDSGAIGYAYHGTTVSVPYPATVNSNDILIAAVAHYGSSGITWTAVSGWTLLYDSLSSGATGNHAFYWKRAAGTESGSVSFTNNYMANNYHFGVIHRISGCITTGDPWDDIGTSVGNGTTVTIASQTASGAERLALSLATSMRITSANDDATSYSRLANLSTTSGIDCLFAVFGYQQASAGATPADSYTKASGAWNVFAEMTVVLAPPAAAAGYAHVVNGVAAANIVKVNGVATASISKVNGV